MLIQCLFVLLVSQFSSVVCQSDPGATLNFTALFEYYGPAFVVPIVLAFIAAIVICIFLCISCCCGTCCSSSACCTTVKIFVLFFTIGFIILLVGCFMALAGASQCSDGINNEITNVYSSFSVASNFLETTENILNSFPNIIRTVLVPALNVTALNETNQLVKKDINEVWGIRNVLVGLIGSTNSIFANIKSDLTSLQQGEKEGLLGNNTVPDPVDVPNVNGTSPYISTLDNGLNAATNESNDYDQQLRNSVPLPGSPGIGTFPNLTYPINLPNFINNLNLESLFPLADISSSIGNVNNTLYSALPTVNTYTTEIQKYVRIYVIVVLVFIIFFALTIVVWYLGMLFAHNLLKGIPLCCSALLLIPLGLLIGLNLGLGGITHGVCIHNLDYIHLLTQNTHAPPPSNSSNEDLSTEISNSLSSVLNNPTAVLSCSGNDTLFSVSGVNVRNILNAMLTSSTVHKLTNISSLVNLDAVDNVALNINVHSQLDSIFNVWDTYCNSNLIIIQNLLAQIKKNMNSSKCISCMQAFENNTLDLITNYHSLNDSVNLLKAQTDILNSVATDIQSIRSTLKEILITSLSFPFLNANYLYDETPLHTLGSCSWIGDIYQQDIVHFFCNSITPDFYVAGWGSVLFALGILIIFPTVFFSIVSEDLESRRDHTD